MAIWTILLSNFRKKKGSLVSICILVFIIAAALSTILNTSNSAVERLYEANKNAKSPQIVNMMTTDFYDKDMNEKIKNAKEVERIEEIPALVFKDIKIGNTKDQKTKILIPYEPKKHSYELENGDKYKDIKKGEIYLPFYFKDKCGCKVGTTVNILAGNNTYSFKVADFFEDPYYGSYMVGTKRIYLNKDDFDILRNTKAKEFNEEIIINTFLKNEYKGTNLDKSIYNLNKEVKIAKYGMDYDTFPVFKDYILSLSDIITAILIGFCVLLFIIVIIIIAHSIISNIDMEYVSIGVLKAMGFSNAQIRLSFIFKYTLVALLSSILGIIASIFILNPIGRFILTDTNLLWKGSISIVLSIEIIAVILFFIFIFTIISTRKITSITPVRAISLGHSPVYFSSRLNFSLDKLTKMPLSLKLALKQIITHSKQYLSLLVVTMLLVSFMISISSLKNVFDEENTAKMFNNFPVDINITYKDKNDLQDVSQMIKYVQDKAGVLLNYRENEVYRIVEDNNILVNVIDNGDVIGETIEGRNPKYDNEVLITKTTGKVFQKDIGDKIIVEDFKKHKREYLIVGINQSLHDNGKNITMLKSGMEKLDSSFEINSINLTVKDKAKVNNIVSKLKKKYTKDTIVIVDAVEEERKQMESLNNAVGLGTSIIYIISVVVCGIICLLLCTKTIQREEIDIGILKSEGFTDTELRLQFTMRFLFVSILGGILGILLNMLMNDAIMSMLLSNVGINKYKTVYTCNVVVMSVLSVCIFISLFSYIVAGRIKRITPKNLIND